MDALKEARLTKQIEDLLTRVESLEASETAFIEELSAIEGIVTELNFRLLFTMRYFQFRKKAATGVLDVSGNPIEEEQSLTLWDLWQGTREDFIRKVQANAEAARADLDAQRQSDSASPQPQASGEGPHAGGSADPESPLTSGAPLPFKQRTH